MLTGLFAFLLLATAGLAVEIRVVDRLRHSDVDEWLAEHVYLPVLRMPALIGFVLGAYPALYGLDTGPPLSALLDFDWFGRALNILFFLPLLLSLLPVAGRISGLVLPLQAVALTALLFSPLAAMAGLAEPDYGPGYAVWTALLVFALAGHFLGNALAARLPNRTRPLYDAVVLCCQIPAIALYGRALGMQFAGT